MKRIIRIVAALAALGLPALASAGVVVIVAASAKVEALKPDQVSQVYLGRLTTLPDGTRLVPVDLAEGSDVRGTFLDQVLGKTDQQYRGYWTRQVFTGKGQPPRVVETEAEVVRLVATGGGFVGYVDSRSVTSQVKVLYRVE